MSLIVLNHQFIVQMTQYLKGGPPKSMMTKSMDLLSGRLHSISPSSIYEFKTFMALTANCLLQTNTNTCSSGSRLQLQTTTFSQTKQLNYVAIDLLPILKIRPSYTLQSKIPQQGITCHTMQGRIWACARGKGAQGPKMHSPNK